MPPFLCRVTTITTMKRFKILSAAIIAVNILVTSCHDNRQEPVITEETTVLELLFKEASEYQKEGRWHEAISAYIEIIFTEPKDHRLVAESMLQMMNSCQSAGEQEDCINILERIQKNPTECVREHLWRDLKVIYAYALYRADQDDKALQVMEEALTLEYNEPTDRRLFRDYSYAAAIVYSNPKKQEEAVQYCKAALEAAERASMNSGVQWTTSMLGRLYMKNGMMSDALHLYKTSVTQSQRTGDIPGLANAYNSLSEIFLKWNYMDEAGIYSDSALALADEVRIKAASVAGDTYRIRSTIKEMAGQTDSALYYINKAQMIYEVLPYNSGNDEADRIMGSLMLNSGDPEEREAGVRHLERVIEKATRIEPRFIAYINLAKMHLEHGNREKHNDLMQAMYDMIRENEESIIYLDENACRYALEHFIDAGNMQAADIFSNLYIIQVDRRSSDNVSRAMADASQKEMKNIHKKEMEKSALRTTVAIISSLAVITVIVLAAYMFTRHKRRKTKVIVSELEKNYRKLAEELNSMAQTIELQNVTDAALVPQIFRKNGESAFRERFDTLYPDFIPALRSAVPNISRNEEILCMMIFLNQDLNQIAYNMGIEKTSVNQNRYRLRKKMGLAKEESLKEKIQEISIIK